MLLVSYAGKSLDIMTIPRGLVNDPTTGYGIFSENMRNAAV